MNDPEFKPRAGAVRYQRHNGEWVCANPGDLFYSTALFNATECWDTKTQSWVQIDDDPDEHIPG